ncbi:hypothetical protein INT43_008981 [Umbelopsis isabellina]|uniref:SPX domain-containing protein n=1 Tax=Mortierella isabellina TaxID=91625 RepID=A0A8H7PW81_MORIS|nr:hypothetical protein INT43_008981 [Umbelopsis isabellina]
MKFGEHLRKQRLPQWRFFYLDYDGLKAVLKDGSSQEAEWTSKDDQQFVDRLITELDKVHSFHALKHGEIQRRIRSCQRRIQTLSNSPHPALSEYLSIQNEITDITCEVQELFWYTRLNYTGFLKIVKKHDRYASHAPRLREQFLMALHNRPFYRSEVFSQLTAELASLYDHARINSASSFNSFASMTPPSIITPIARQHQPLVYKTTKYLVHLDNVMDVKTHLLKYMPLISQNSSPTPQSVLNDSIPSSQEYKPSLAQAIGECHSDETISSIYLDDQHFSSYMARIQFLAEPQTIRLRWYGSDTTDLHVERKAYGYGKHETVEGLPNSQDELNESSSKDRHPIKAKWVPEWLNGQWDARERLSKAYQKQRFNTFDWVGEEQDDEAHRIQNVAKDIQDTVQSDQLRPVIRTVFRRTVFQSQDESVRVSLDTDVVMAQEFGWNDPDSPIGDHWRRNDVTEITANEDYFLDIPPDHQNANDIYKFPYAIVEVKLRASQDVSLTDTDEPDCVKNLIRARLMEPVAQFSKYVHAVSILWEANVPLLPFWLPQLHAGVYCPTGIRLTRPYHSTAESADTSNATNDSTAHRSDDRGILNLSPAPPLLPRKINHHLSLPMSSNVPSLTETTPLLGSPTGEQVLLMTPLPRRTIAHSIRRLVQAVYPVVLVILIVAIALVIAEIEDRMLANVLGVLVAAMALAGFCLWMFVFKTSLTQTTM